MSDELLKGLTDEQLKKARECKSEEELLDLAKKEGVQLTDEQLASVSGGCGQKEQDTVCPTCGSTNLSIEVEEINSRDVTLYTCQDCNFHWRKNN